MKDQGRIIKCTGTVERNECPLLDERLLSMKGVLPHGM
jgi:hypothetical protein